MPQLGRNQREWERENLENECGSQKSVREVRESENFAKERVPCVRCAVGWRNREFLGEKS